MQFSVKYRPRNFSDVVGQKVSVQILKNSIKMRRVPAALLVSGIRGVGKTTIARIYAKALNCGLNSLDNPTGDACGVCASCSGSELNVVELDAASNNGVDDIRSIEQISRQKPVGAYRVFILDEAHMLSRQAQAAFLKLLEEPPQGNVFILVTTDPQQLTDTIRSRCLSFPLEPLNIKAIEENLRTISKKENVGISNEVISVLARSGGSLRDVQQLLERASLFSDKDALLESLGILSTKEYKKLAQILDSKNLKFGIEQINNLYNSGVDLSQLFSVGLPNLLNDFIVFLSCPESDLPNISGIPKTVLESNLCLRLNDVKNMLMAWEDLFEIAKQTDNMISIWVIYLTKIFINELETGVAFTP